MKFYNKNASVCIWILFDEMLLDIEILLTCTNYDENLSQLNLRLNLPSSAMDLASI